MEPGEVEIYRESNLELLTSEEQRELDAVECARVLHTPLLRARSRSTSSDKSRSRQPSISRSFEILTFPIDPSASRMSSSASMVADEARKRLRIEEEMMEFEADCRKELNTKRTLLLEEAIDDGLDVSALSFLSPSSPGRSKSAAASDELTKLVGKSPHPWKCARRGEVRHRNRSFCEICVTIYSGSLGSPWRFR